jgi:hypothetical protein
MLVLKALLFLLLEVGRLMAYEKKITSVIEDIIRLDNKPAQLTMLNNCWNFGK